VTPVGPLRHAVPMETELKPITSPGTRFVELCEEHAADFATRADEHDRESSFPLENVKAMQESGVAAACVPEQFGGLGLDSIHDLTTGVNRLGRGDGSTAIAINMHLTATWVVARAWRELVAKGDHERAAPLEFLLSGVGGGALVVCVLGTEAGAYAGYPLAELTPVEGGYRLHGRKAFGTLSPAANLMLVACRLRQDEHDNAVFAAVDPNADGVVLRDNWDALGMRASGSQDVVLEGVFVPEGTTLTGGTWGALTPTAITNILAGTSGLTGAFLGIAEEAHRLGIELVTTRKKAPSERGVASRPSIQHAIAESEIDLATSRGVIAHSAGLADDYYATHTNVDAGVEDLHGLFAQIQAAKTHVNAAAIRIVDRALTVSGGAGYMTANPLSRLYRDVRAGPFMQQYSPNEVYEYIGKVALRLDPTLDL
jgi:L-evernosamine nitrososynthase